MDCELEPISSDDSEQIVEIFNFYVENSFAAFPENRVPTEFFNVLMEASGAIPSSPPGAPAGGSWDLGFSAPTIRCPPSPAPPRSPSSSVLNAKGWGLADLWLSGSSMRLRRWESPRSSPASPPETMGPSPSTGGWVSENAAGSRRSGESGVKTSTPYGCRRCFKVGAIHRFPPSFGQIS